jgi:CheY-like chemotaxis protein
MAGTSAGRPKILVVDDNQQIVDVIRHTIRRQGIYDIIIANDGIEGLECYYTENPICIVVDAKMPRMDGFQFMRFVRGDPASTHTALVMLTAMVREEDELTGLLSGADEYLVKPFKPSALIAAIERAIHVSPEERIIRLNKLLHIQQKQ